MKRCPRCDTKFPDSDQFCEIDGTVLITDYPVYPQSSERTPVTFREQYVSLTHNERSLQNWKVIAVAAVAGVVIAIAFFIIYQMTRPVPQQTSNEPSSNGALGQQQQPYPPMQHASIPTESLSPEPSPSPTVLPSPASPTEPAHVALSSSPVSTSGAEKGKSRVIIRLTNGTSVEADEAWETGEGIWYRRSGVVSLLERKDVKEIERVIENASPTPTSSPVKSP